ncbi:hypothetical protein ONZ45_g16750 [Pleurotus djamor]|nr:hypothetical protein ONZ45_g16750 [Pleurotus djamor]
MYFQASSTQGAISSPSHLTEAANSSNLAATPHLRLDLPITMSELSSSSPSQLSNELANGASHRGDQYPLPSPSDTHNQSDNKLTHRHLQRLALPVTNEMNIGDLLAEVKQHSEHLALLSKMSAKQNEILEKHITLLSQMNTRQAQQDLAQQPIPQVSLDNASVWDPLHRSMMNNISPTLDKWRGGLDTLLVFVGLFSGIVTSFLVDSFDQLRPDPQERTNELLVNLTEIYVATHRNNGTVPLEFTQPEDFVPDTAGVRLNVYWALSLVLALTAAALAVLARGFISRLIKPDGKAKEKVIDLYQRWPNAQETFGPLMSWLPLNLILPVALFMVGLLDAMISSATDLEQLNIALVIMSVIGCLIVTLAVGVGFAAVVHGTLHPHSSPFKIKLPFLREWSRNFRRAFPSSDRPASDIVSEFSINDMNAQIKDLDAFNTVICKTFEDPLLDSAAGALESIFKHPYMSKSPEIYSTMCHLLSPEASIRSNITVALSLYQRHTSTIGGLPFKPEEGKALLNALVGCTKRNPRLLSVPCSQDDPTPTLCASVAIVLVHYVAITDLEPNDIMDTYTTLSKALVDSPPAQQFQKGMLYILTASARLISHCWMKTTMKHIGCEILFNDQGSAPIGPGTQTQLMLLSAHALQWLPSVHGDFRPFTEYIQSLVLASLSNITSSKRTSMSSPYAQLESVFRGLDSTGNLMAFLLGVLFWDNDKNDLPEHIWKGAIDWVTGKMMARNEILKVDELFRMTTNISGQAHVAYTERLCYLAISRIRTHPQHALAVCCQALNLTWKVPSITHIAGRQFQHLILAKQDTYDELLTIFIDHWNHHKDHISTDTVRAKHHATTTYNNIFIILFLVLNEGLNITSFNEDSVFGKLVHIAMQKVIILNRLEAQQQSQFSFVLISLCIHIVVVQTSLSKISGAPADFEYLFNFFADRITDFIIQSQNQDYPTLPLHDDIQYLIQDKSRRDPIVIVAKTLIKICDFATANSEAASLLFERSPQQAQRIIDLHTEHQDWIHEALINKD